MQIKKILIGAIKINFPFVLAISTSFLCSNTSFAEHHGQTKPAPSGVISVSDAKTENFEWGSLTTYYSGETHGTTDGLWAVATIKAGNQIHPPHTHAEEEYLMVIEGEGTWHLNGKEFPAKAGDTMYSLPWDSHAIKNTGTTPLKFVVWKWNNKGLKTPKPPKK